MSDESKALFCSEHGPVQAQLLRGDHRYAQVVVKNALAYVCPHCEQALAFPAASSGRIAKAMKENNTPRRLELRVAAEVVDQVLAVHAALGTLGLGEDFVLPLHLGLQVAARESQPKPSWMAYDTAKSLERARPLVSPAIEQRLKGLQRAWGARSMAQLVGWLVVAAAEAVRAGLAHEVSAPAQTLELCVEPVATLPLVTYHWDFDTSAIARELNAESYTYEKVA